MNRLMAEHLGHAPDLLSTDVEGLDYAILQTLSKGYEMHGASMDNVIFADPKRYVRA
jgi:hypothetical protein